jgi:hypothetical protein
LPLPNEVLPYELPIEAPETPAPTPESNADYLALFGGDNSGGKSEKRVVVTSETNNKKPSRMFNPFGGAVNYKAPVDLITRTVKTKVMCTVGQTNSSKRDLAKLLIAGMNIARFNASHGTHAVRKRFFFLKK